MECLEDTKKDDPGSLSISKSGRIYQLENRIRLIEKYGNSIAGRGYNIECRKAREELKELLREEEQLDLLRRIPLYSSKITGYRFLCSTCYDKKYLETFSKRKEQ